MLDDVLTLHTIHFCRMGFKCTGVALGFLFLEMSVLIMVLILAKAVYQKDWPQCSVIMRFW